MGHALRLRQRFWNSRRFGALQQFQLSRVELFSLPDPNTHSNEQIHVLAQKGLQTFLDPLQIRKLVGSEGISEDLP